MERLYLFLGEFFIQTPTDISNFGSRIASAWLNSGNKSSAADNRNNQSYLALYSYSNLRKILNRS